MAKKLHIDIETYSSVDLKSSGAYKYAESIDFEILLICYAVDSGPIVTLDLASGDLMPQGFIDALFDPEYEKHAHNAAFERICFRAAGYDVPIEQWHCNAIKSGYCGLPLSLGQISKALKLTDKGKLATGSALIRYFCIPCKPTKTNGHRHRNLPHHNPEKWEDFRVYCAGDVIAERHIGSLNKKYQITAFERSLYILDQQINDRGILIDLQFAKNAIALDDINATIVNQKIKDISGIDNPNSTAQLRAWLSEAMQKEIKSLAKEEIPKLLDEAEAGTVSELLQDSLVPLRTELDNVEFENSKQYQSEAAGVNKRIENVKYWLSQITKEGTVSDILKLRQRGSKTSIKKYYAMLACICSDERGRGLFQFYGASRTGRWAGRLIQLQNLPQNKIKDLQTARDLFATGDFEIVSMAYSRISDILSQLIRTAFVAPKGKTFAVADFSAIEARVIAWLAGEQWRIDIFKGHGKIYEASAAMMFNVPIEEVTRENGLRAKGKVAELALGYQGSVGALEIMGGERMGLSKTEMKAIVTKWRLANPAIVRFWKKTEQLAKLAVRNRKRYVNKMGNLAFDCDGTVLTIELPSGRKLFYRNPSFGQNKFGSESLRYKGIHQVTRQWTWVDTYGGKLVENIVQAVARDLLAVSLIRLDKAGFDLVMHVHDEAAAEVLIEKQTEKLDEMCAIMGQDISWAKGLPLNADGYLTPFYKKD